MRSLLFGFGLLLSLAVPAFAEEAIRNFVSDVTVNADASLVARETITIYSDGETIRHGIKRDFPTTYYDRQGQRVRVGFDVLAVERDGQAEPFVIESISNGKRIKIGSADVYLNSGSHTWQITYRTTRQLGFFAGFDELYWNATGNGWDFPIEKATAILRLPPGAIIQEHHEYTGVQGSIENDSAVLAASGSEYRASTTRRLGSREGFTIAVAWQKGIVTAPTRGELMRWWLQDNAGFFALIASIVAAGLFYFYAWNKVGRDPPTGVIVPLFKPPEGLGPPGTRFVWKQGFDDRCLAAALVGLAVKGRVRIIDDDGEYSVEKRPNAGPALTGAEQALYAGLDAGTTEFKKANHAALKILRGGVEKALRDEYDGTLFIRNIGWFWKGAVISAAGLVLSALLLPAEESVVALFTVGWSTIWWGAILTFLWAAIKGSIGQRGIFKKLGSLAGALFLIPFIFGGVAAPAALLFSSGSAVIYMLVGAAIILGIMNVVFFHLLRAPTIPGARILGQIEGFRMYLKTAEEDRLNVLNPPEKTPALFERYLPYALALDCENEWNAKFAAVLAAAAAAGAAAPAWYSGNQWDSGRSDGFTQSLGSSLASSISSASTAPGSSSGSGGGGSSGGGGGGGGGSGW